MHRHLILTFMLAVLAASSHAKPAPEPLKASFLAAVAVDEHGRVTDVQFHQEGMSDAIRMPLERDVRGWEFEPARIDGQPAPSVTQLLITVLAEPTGVGDAYALRIIHASNGPAYDQIQPPRYPLTALRSRTAARLVLAVEIDADGKVVAATVDSIRSTGNRHTKMLSTHTIDAVSKWTFIPEQVAGQPIGSSIKVPVNFCLDGVPCFEDDAANGSGGNEPIAERPAVQLKTEVTGRRL